MKKRHEEGSADDRPHDRKRITAHAKDEWLGEVELPRDPRSNQGTDEPDGGRYHEATARSAAKSPADGAADGGDNDQHDEPWQCERHANPPWAVSAEPLRDVISLSREPADANEPLVALDGRAHFSLIRSPHTSPDGSQCRDCRGSADSDQGCADRT